MGSVPKEVVEINMLRPCLEEYHRRVWPHRLKLTIGSWSANLARVGSVWPSSSVVAAANAAKFAASVAGGLGLVAFDVSMSA